MFIKTFKNRPFKAFAISFSNILQASSVIYSHVFNKNATVTPMDLFMIKTK